MEEVEFQCEGCGELLRISIDDQEKWIRCPNCQAVQICPAMRGPQRPNSIHRSTSGSSTGNSRNQRDSFSGAPSQADSSWSIRFASGSVRSGLSRQQLEQMIRDGVVNDTCFFVGPHYPQWTPIGVLFQSETGPKTPPFVPGSSAGGQQPRPPQSIPESWTTGSPSTAGGSPYRPPSSHHMRSSQSQAEAARTNDSTVLVLGILSLAICCFPLGPIGLFIGVRDLIRVHYGEAFVRDRVSLIIGTILCVISSIILFLAIFPNF